MRKPDWLKQALKRERDAAVVVVTRREAKGEDAVSDSGSSSSGVSVTDTKPLKKGSKFSIAVLRLLLSFITLLPFRFLSTRTLALQFNGWCERNGLTEVPTFHRTGVHRALTKYIPKKLGTKVDVRSLLFSPKRLTARVADMWWAFAEAMHAVPPSEHDHMGRGKANLRRFIWMDEFPLYLRKTRGTHWGVKGFKASGEGAGGRMKMTAIMAVCSTGILKLEVIQGGCKDKDYERFMVGTWDSKAKQYTGGLLDCVRGMGFHFLVQDNLGRSGRAKNPIKGHFNP
jgi:hypothetical protein